MARTESELTTFTLASDYNSAHYNWMKKELAALGNYKAVAEVIKKRLEDNGAKVKEMYVVEHKGEEKVDSQSGEHHKIIEETKIHYHILIKFEPTHGAAKDKIAKYIGVPQNAVEKLKPGGYSYYNVLAYLTHIKDESKIQYAPEAVVTLAGTDYMDYFNENKERWVKARAIVAKKGGKTRDRRFRVAMGKLDRGELTYNELALTKEYCDLLTDSKYQKKLFTKSKLVIDLAEIHRQNTKKKIENMEINSWEQIEESEQFKLLQTYGYTQDLKNALEAAIKNSLQNDFLILQQGIVERKIHLPFENIEACEEYKAVCKYYKKEIETEMRCQAEREYRDLYYAIINGKITRVEAKTSEKYTYAYLFFKDDIEEKPMPYHEPTGY